MGVGGSKKGQENDYVICEQPLKEKDQKKEKKDFPKPNILDIICDKKIYANFQKKIHNIVGK